MPLERPYIDRDYYENDYMGKQFEDDEEFKKAIIRASEAIDNMTSYNTLSIKSNDKFVISQVKKATAAMVELYIEAGGYNKYHKTSSGGFSIGNFSKASDSASSQLQQSYEDSKKKYPDVVMQYLIPTGLLYAGIGVVK